MIEGELRWWVESERKERGWKWRMEKREWWKSKEWKKRRIRRMKRKKKRKREE